jgi:hypothetical protein
VQSVDAVVRGRTLRHVVVVADRFAQFGLVEHVLTLTDLRALLAAGGPPGCEWVVHWGQGIEQEDRELVGTAVGGLVVRVADGEALPLPVTPEIVHKQRPENVLLAGIRIASEVCCSAELRIHRGNELILDHHTGQHVQGMVIVEAMRQICIAQFETGYRPRLPKGGYVGVWKRLNLSFEGFLFPVRATVESEITCADLSREANLGFRATTSVRQNGDVIASAEIEYSMIKQDRMETLERRKAGQAAHAQAN